MDLSTIVLTGETQNPVITPDKVS